MNLLIKRLQGRSRRVCIGVVLFYVALVSVACGQTWNVLDTTPGTVAGSALDLSFLADAPAGKYGRVVIDAEGDLRFSGDSTRKIRFYGANLPGDRGLTHAQIDVLVSRLASMGYNIARLLGQDGMESWGLGIFNPPTSTDPAQLTFNSAKLEQLDYLFAQLRSRGIYVQLDLFCCFSFANIPALASYNTSPAYLFPFVPEAYALWQRAAEMYLSHVNPYTGLALKDDPMVVAISPWNETLIINMRNPNATFSAVLLAQYNQFLVSKGVPPVTSFPVTSTAQNPSTDNYWNINGTTKEYLTEFYTQKTIATYNSMKSYLRNTLQTQAILYGFNFINDPVTNYWRNQCLDAFESHYYYQWDAVTVTPGSGIYVYNPVKYRMLSEVFAVLDSLPIRSYPALALNQEYRKPMFLTEFHDVFPNIGRDQAPLVAGAIGAFQGWDGLNRFIFTQKAAGAGMNYRVGAFNEFEMVSDPLAIITEYQGLLAFQSGYVQSASPRFVMVRDKTYCKTNQSACWETDKISNFYYLPYLYNIQTVYADVPSTPFALYKVTSDLSPTDIANGIIPAANRVNITTTMSRTQVAQACLSKLSDSNPAEYAIKTAQQAALNAGQLRSETGELLFDLNNKTFTVNTPRLIGAAGTLNNTCLTFSSAGATLQSSVAKGTLTAGSLDGLPLGQSTRILIINTTDARATGVSEVTRTDSTVIYTIPDSNGVPNAATPNLVLYATGRFTLTTALNPLGYHAYKLGLNGTRLGTLPVSISGNVITVDFNTSSGFAIEVEYVPPVVVYQQVFGNSSGSYVTLASQGIDWKSYFTAWNWNPGAGWTGVGLNPGTGLTTTSGNIGAGLPAPARSLTNGMYTTSGGEKNQISLYTDTVTLDPGSHRALQFSWYQQAATDYTRVLIRVAGTWYLSVEKFYAPTACQKTFTYTTDAANWLVLGTRVDPYNPNVQTLTTTASSNLSGPITAFGLYLDTASSSWNSVDTFTVTTFQ